MIEINSLKSVIKTTNTTIDYLVEKLILATARLEKQNDPCPYCDGRRYFDTCIASIEPEYYATCENCCVNFFFTREELKEMENVQKHDRIKYNYCKDNNINLQYITYQDNIIQRLEEILNGL